MPNDDSQEDGFMSELKTDREAREWTDAIPDDEETERPEPDEETSAGKKNRQP